MLTLTTVSMDTRDDLPKVPYATALDWFVIMCFCFVTGTLLEFAGVHYFTKLGTGEFPFDSESEENISQTYFRQDCMNSVSWDIAFYHSVYSIISLREEDYYVGGADFFDLVSDLRVTYNTFMTGPWCCV